MVTQFAFLFLGLNAGYLLFRQNHSRLVFHVAIEFKS